MDIPTVYGLNKGPYTGNFMQCHKKQSWDANKQSYDCLFVICWEILSDDFNTYCEMTNSFISGRAAIDKKVSYVLTWAIIGV